MAQTEAYVRQAIESETASDGRRSAPVVQRPPIPRVRAPDGLAIVMAHPIPQTERVNKWQQKKARRPTGYKPEYATRGRKSCASLGRPMLDLAQFFDVSDRTIYRWQTEFPEFCQALKAGKIAADDRVERSLYHRAVGFTHDAVKIFMPAGAKEAGVCPVPGNRSS